MPQLVRDQLIVLAAAVLVFFTNLGVPQLWDEDEPRNAACAREMLERGDWVVPTFNYELRTQKPVLLYWCMLVSYSIFGVNEFAARLPSALFAVGTSLLTFHLGRMLFNARVGLFAGLTIATCLMFGVSGRAATPDSTLIFFVTLSLTVFVFAVAQRRNQAFSHQIMRDASANPGLGDFLPSRWWQFAAVYAMLGLAMLAKGPVGVGLPIAILGLFLLLVTRPQSSVGATLGRRTLSFVVRFADTAWAMRPLTLIAVVLSVALPWYVLVGIRTDGAWLRDFFGTENLSRFRSAMEGHDGWVIYYIPAILVGLFPWSIFLPVAGWFAVRNSIMSGPRRPAYLFLLCWAGVWITVFSFAGTKLPSYVLPAYPALALICAVFVDDWLTRPVCVPRWLMQSAWIALILVGAGLMVGLPLAARTYLQGDEMIALVGLIPLFGGLLCVYWFRRQQPRHVIASLGITAVAFSATIFGGVAVRASRHQNSESLIEIARRVSSDGDVELATFRHAESSLVFYAGERVSRFGEVENARQFFETNPSGFLITNDEAFDKLSGHLPPGVTVVARQPRFLKWGEVLLLGRETHSANAPSAQSRWR
jgi:4-amino-4-deoxy-L-arabinose transferase-like glycosyltransferase